MTFVTVDRHRTRKIARPYAEYRAAPFPPGLRGRDIAGVDMDLLDADIAGCVEIWLHSGGQLEPHRREVLARCMENLDHVVPS